MSSLSRRYGTAAFLAAGAVTVLFLALFIAAAPLPFEAALLSLRGYDTDLRNLLPQFDVRAMRRAAWLLGAAASGALALALFFRAHSARLEPLRDRLFTFFVGLGSAVSLFLVLWRAGFEAPWYPLQRILSNPGSVPIFGHRLLLVWPARAFELAAHSGPRPAFFLLQALAIVAATYMVIRWSALFIGPALAWMGGPLLVLFLAPTFLYLTSYDVAIVFFHCLGLWALHQRRWAWFVAAVAVGTLNHENVLILIPAALVVLWGQVSRRVLIAVPAAALAGHLLARAALHRIVPLPGLFELHVWTNAVLLEQMHRTMIEGLAVLIVFFAVAALTFRDAGPFLKRASLVILLQLVLIAFVAGRFNEARNFESFIPLLIALVLSSARRQWRATIQ